MTVSGTSANSNVGTISFAGINSGLNTTAIIAAYVAQDSGPLNDLQSQNTALNAQITDYQTLQTQLTSLQTAADALSSPTAFNGDVAASSSNTAVATATTSTGATTGSTTFSVNQLATANTLVSSGTVASTNDVVASGDLLVASGGSALGLTSLAGSGLTTGTHSITVTQASSAATLNGGTVGASTAISAASGNNVLSGTLNGTAFSYTIADGTYSTSGLASAIDAASGGALVAKVASNGQLSLSSAAQGSTASLTIGSGSANAVLGLSAGASAAGTDAVVNVDGTSTTISTINGSTPTTVSLASGTGGTVSATIGSGLSLGTVSANNVAVGNGSLASVVSAINGAGTGVSAEALQVGANSFALELTSTSTGAGNDVSVDPSAFSSSGLGSLETTTAGQDAIITLGGTSGYAISSATNDVSGVLPGVTLHLASTSSAPVTISVAANGQAAASTVQTFVTAANTLLSTIAEAVSYNATTNVAGPLNGDNTLITLQNQVLSAIGTAIGKSSAIDSGTAGSAAGLSLSSTGTINFNATTFATDYDKNPSGVAAMFNQQGSFSPTSGSGAAAGDISLVYANDLTQAGSYDVTVTHSASQASDTGSTVFAGPSATVSAAGTYAIVSGGTTVNYSNAAGATLSSVATGLDAAFAQAGVDLTAQIVPSGSGSALQITSSQYGAGQSFTVAATGADPLGIVGGGSFAGSDVAGSINGVAATGSGDVVTAPTTDPVLAGLALQVTTPGITSSTSLGTWNYQPGLAQGVATIAALANEATTGQFPAKIAQLQATQTGVENQITLEQQVVNEQKAALTSEFNNLETTLTALKSESNYINQAFGTSSNNVLSGLSSNGNSGNSNSSSSSGSTTTGG